MKNYFFLIILVSVVMPSVVIMPTLKFSMNYTIYSIDQIKFIKMPSPLKKMTSYDQDPNF